MVVGVFQMEQPFALTTDICNPTEEGASGVQDHSQLYTEF